MTGIDPEVDAAAAFKGSEPWPGEGGEPSGDLPVERIRIRTPIQVSVLWRLLDAINTVFPHARWVEGSEDEHGDVVIEVEIPREGAYPHEPVLPGQYPA